jgi:hypothetical protein
VTFPNAEKGGGRGEGEEVEEEGEEGEDGISFPL